MSDEKLIEKDASVEEKVESNVPENETQAQEQVFGGNTEAKEEPKAEKRVPLHELQKERQRRRMVEEEMSKLRKDVEDLRSNYSKVSESSEEENLVSEYEKELGVDREQARKLVKLTKKTVGKREEAKPQPLDPIALALGQFKQNAESVAQDYDDWNDHTATMQAIFNKELQENGLVAAQRSPHWYYNQAVKAKAVSDRTNKAQRDAERAENANLAQTDSGGSSKSGGSSRITQAVFDANRKDPEWVRANIDEIRALADQGKIK